MELQEEEEIARKQPLSLVVTLSSFVLRPSTDVMTG